MNTDSINTGSRLKTAIENGQLLTGKTDEQCSLEIGWNHANTLTLVKQGKMKMPYSKLAQLAAALSIDPPALLRAMMEDDTPELLGALEALWEPLNMTTNERQLIASFRQLAGGQDVVPTVMDGRLIVALITA